MSFNSREIVIARYNEDVSWAYSLPKDVKINLFNKGPDSFLLDGAHNVKLENFGRESGTYLKFIVSRYDTLPDVCLLARRA